MIAIYEPTGPAKEYADLACNLYAGCTNGCRYCYVPQVLRKSREDFHSGCALRPGILEQLVKDAPKYAGRDVFLCFTSDPYPEGDANFATREALCHLNDNGIRATVLSKHPERAWVDFPMLSTGSRLGTTITVMDETWETLEPQAAAPWDRLWALQDAHGEGVETFVSIEPYFSDTALEAVRMAHEWVDQWWIGATGKHTPKGLLPPHDLRELTRLMALELEFFGCKYLFKESLAAYLPEGVARTNIVKELSS